jgi:hypothetical protein
MRFFLLVSPFLVLALACGGGKGEPTPTPQLSGKALAEQADYLESTRYDRQAEEEYYQNRFEEDCDKAIGKVGDEVARHLGNDDLAELIRDQSYKNCRP